MPEFARNVLDTADIVTDACCGTCLMGVRGNHGRREYGGSVFPFWTVNNVPFAFTPKPCQNSIPLWLRVDCFCLGRSAKPIAQSRNILAGGFARGCVSNTKSGEGGIRNFPRRPRISGLAWSALQRGPPVFRGRQREPFFESW